MSYRKHQVKNKVHKLKPKKHIYKSPLFWWVLLAVILVFGAGYLFLFLPQIQVNNIVVFGNQKVKSQDIENITRMDIAQKFSASIFLADTGKIQNDILKNYPVLSQVKVSKKFPDTVNITVQERQPVAVFCTTNQAPPKDCYFIDDAGVIFEALKENTDNFSVVRNNLQQGQVFTGEEVVNKNIIDAILKTQKMLKDNYNINVLDSMVTTPVRLNVKTSENWQVYFGLDSDVLVQISQLKILLKDQIPEEARKKLEYIDLRFGDKAFYK